jgi:CheY-like chemotaxis protein
LARILIVDDEMAVRTFVARALSQRGHTVDQVGDGASALACLGEAPDISLLISDIVMPGMDGLALAEKARRDWPGLRILLMTGYAGGHDRDGGPQGVGDDIILKPFSLTAICNAVDRVLDGAHH